MNTFEDWQLRLRWMILLGYLLLCKDRSFYSFEGRLGFPRINMIEKLSLEKGALTPERSKPGKLAIWKVKSYSSSNPTRTAKHKGLPSKT